MLKPCTIQYIHTNPYSIFLAPSRVIVSSSSLYSFFAGDGIITIPTATSNTAAAAAAAGAAAAGFCSNAGGSSNISSSTLNDCFCYRFPIVLGHVLPDSLTLQPMNSAWMRSAYIP